MTRDEAAALLERTAEDLRNGWGFVEKIIIKINLVVKETPKEDK